MASPRYNRIGQPSEKYQTPTNPKEFSKNLKLRSKSTSRSQVAVVIYARMLIGRNCHLTVWPTQRPCPTETSRRTKQRRISAWQSAKRRSTPFCCCGAAKLTWAGVSLIQFRLCWFLHLFLHHHFSSSTSSSSSSSSSSLNSRPKPYPSPFHVYCYGV